MIPTSTGAAKAVAWYYLLKGSLTALQSSSTPNVSLIDFTLVTEKNVTSEGINEAMSNAAD